MIKLVFNDEQAAREVVRYSPYLKQNIYTQDYYIKKDRTPEERNEDSNRRNSWGRQGHKISQTDQG